MKNFILILIATLTLTSCAFGGKDPENPDMAAEITGVWIHAFPTGIQSEGFEEWSFSRDGKLEVHIYDAFTGDQRLDYLYELWIQGSSVNVYGYVDTPENGSVRVSFASFDIAKLTEDELKLKCVWYNDDMAYLEQTTPFRYDSSVSLTFTRQK